MADSRAPAVPNESVATVATRSPSDVLRLVVATLLLIALTIVERAYGDTLVSFATGLLRGLSSVPSWLLDGMVAVTHLGTIVFLVGGLVLGVMRGRWRLLFVVAVAVALALVLVVVMGPLDPNAGNRVVDLQGLIPPGFPTAGGLAAAAAFATAGAPWLTRRWRRIAWCLVVATTFSRFLVVPIAFDSIRALLTGWFAGAASLVLLGAPTRRPTGAAIIEGLEVAGVPMASLDRVGLDARGSTPYLGTAADGRRLFVKVLGVDERSADLMFRMYRSVVPHNLGDDRPFSSLRRAVEHEAFVALIARDLGVRTPLFVTLARAEPNAFVLVFEAIEGRSLDSVDVEDLDDATLREVWVLVEELHRHRIAHRDLRLANVFQGGDGAIWLIDFGFGEAAASDLLVSTDRAELVASTATRVGAPRAVAAAVAIAGPAALVPAAARLRTWALSGATRAALKADPALLPTIKHEVALATSALSEDARAKAT